MLRHLILVTRQRCSPERRSSKKRRPSKQTTPYLRILHLVAICFVCGYCLPIKKGSAAENTVGDHDQTVRSLAAIIDNQINASAETSGMTPLLDDRSFLRRVMLDLAGRIPSKTEQERYQALENPDKRFLITKELINSPDFAYHQRNELDTLLLRPLTNDSAWRDYLLEATQTNRSWDRIFREVLVPETSNSEDLRPVAFLKHRMRDLDKMANDASVIWFGVNIGCAKCHDHPLVDDWKQAHYYGIASFFKRTYQTKKGMLGERFDGKIRYDTTEGETHDGEFMYLTGAKAEEPVLNLEEEVLRKYDEQIKNAERQADAESPPVPDFRPRNELVEMALNDQEQKFFAKNIANRLWARFFGRGLTHPLDQIHSGNPPSHPEIMDEIANALVKHDYDLQILIHAITLSDAYARALPAIAKNAGESKLTQHDHLVHTFSHAMPRALTPHQLSLSLLIATKNPDKLQNQQVPEKWVKERQAFEKRSEKLAQELEIPGDNFQVPITEALWFSNSPQMQKDYLKDGQEQLVGYLKNLESDQKIIEMAIATILCRTPLPEENETLLHYLRGRPEKKLESIQHIVWALLCSPEFRFNH